MTMKSSCCTNIPILLTVVVTSSRQTVEPLETTTQSTTNEIQTPHVGVTVAPSEEEVGTTEITTTTENTTTGELSTTSKYVQEISNHYEDLVVSEFSLC